MKRKRLLFIITGLLVCLSACSNERKVKPRETEEVTLEQGIQAIEENAHEKAIVVLTKVIEREPENAAAYIYRGDAYMYAAEEIITEIKLPDVSKDEGSVKETQGQSADKDIVNDSELIDEMTDEEKNQKIEEYLNNAKEDYSKGEEYNYEDSDYLDKQKQTLENITVEFMEKQTAPTDEEKTMTANALTTAEYAIVVSAMQQMGCSDVSWDIWDGDGDGNQELYLTAYADDNYRQSQLLADISGPYMTAHAATGAAGSSEYITIYGFDSYILQDGYYTAGNTQVNYYEWNGSQWEQVNPATGAADYAVFSNPDLTCTWMDIELDQAVSLMHDTLIERENFMGDFHMDMDADGIEEYVYFYQGAANRWFGRLKSDNNFGSEYYLNYTDYTTTAIVVNWNAERNQTCLRVANFGETYGLDVVIDGNIMTFDGEDYAYQKEGTPFLYQGLYEEEFIPEMMTGMEIDLGYIIFTIPESWSNRVATFTDGLSLEIYEINDYYLGGGGYIRTIGLSTEYESNHPARNLYASVEADGTVYYLYTLEPTDVPYIDMNNVAAGMAISEELNLQFLLDHIRAKEGYSLDWFIG